MISRPEGVDRDSLEMAGIQPSQKIWLTLGYTWAAHLSLQNASVHSTDPYAIDAHLCI